MTEAPVKPNRRERRIVERKPSRSWNSAIEPMKPNGMIPAARAANTAICFGIDNASASGAMPAEVAKSSAPTFSAQSRGWARAISARRKKAAAVSTIAISRVVPGATPRWASTFVHDFGDQPHMFGTVGLWQTQRHDARAHRGLDIAHRQAQGPVDADDDIGAAARHDLGRLRHQRPRPLLLGGRHAVFEIEDDSIGAAPTAPSTKRHCVTGTNSNERQTGSGAAVIAALRRGR